MVYGTDRGSFIYKHLNALLFLVGYFSKRKLRPPKLSKFRSGKLLVSAVGVCVVFDLQAGIKAPRQCQLRIKILPLTLNIILHLISQIYHTTPSPHPMHVRPQI